MKAEFDIDYFEPPCQTDADCEPAWNEYFVCKCVDLKCKWLFAERPIKPEVPKIRVQCVEDEAESNRKALKKDVKASQKTRVRKLFAKYKDLYENKGLPRKIRTCLR
ncbi:hypothetical protein P8452_43766 [Trifolium repens]|nr:hypothetical protein P8452_43766 [Trifolium repens]